MILLTGFAPFGGDPENPSRLSARLAASMLLEAGIPASFLELPVVFARAGPAVVAEIARLNAITPHDPVSVVICVGLAGNRAVLSLETTAVNLQDARIPDNDGDQPRGTPVIPVKPRPGDKVMRAQGAIHVPVPTPAAPTEPVAKPGAQAEPNSNPAATRTGAATLPSRLPIPAIRVAIEKAHVPVEISADAGLYVCNAVFYYTLHELGEEVKVGFVHVPPDARVPIEKQAYALVIAAKTAAGYDDE